MNDRVWQACQGRSRPDAGLFRLRRYVTRPAVKITERKPVLTQKSCVQVCEVGKVDSEDRCRKSEKQEDGNVDQQLSRHRFGIMLLLASTATAPYGFFPSFHAGTKFEFASHLTGSIIELIARVM
jgi:hypothetical protein